MGIALVPARSESRSRCSRFGMAGCGSGANHADGNSFDVMAGMPGMNHTAATSDGSTDPNASYWNEVSGGRFVPDGTVRRYYISADEVVWDYAPDGRNDITGEPFDDVANTYVKNGRGRIGSRYLKCLLAATTMRRLRALLARSPSDRYRRVARSCHPRRGRRHDRGRVP